MKKNILFYLKKILSSDGDFLHSTKVFVDHSLTSCFQEIKLNKKWNYCIILLLLFGQVILAQNPAANIDQGKNETPVAPLSPVVWVNGNLNANQAHLLEGYSVPYRARLTNLVIGSTNTLIIGIDTRDGSKAALDYYTSYQRLLPHSQFLPAHPQEIVDPTDGVAGVVDGSSPSDLFDIPIPSTAGTPVPGQPAASFGLLPVNERQIAIWNGDITSVVYDSEDNLSAAHTKTNLKITFTASASSVVIAWGGHIARNDEWNGGAHPGGSPYHCRLISLNGVGGNQDRSLKSEAVFTCDIEGPDSVCGNNQTLYTSVSNIQGASYSWLITNNSSGASFAGATNGNSVAVNPGSFSGSFTLNVNILTSSGGITCSHTIIVNQAATANAGPDDSKCRTVPGPTVFTMNGQSSGGTYLWSVDPANANVQIVNPSSLSTNVNITGTGTFILRLTTTNANSNCPNATDTVVLTINPNPTVTVNSPTKCANDPAVSIIATPSPAGNYSYAWTVPQGANDPGNVASFSASIAGQYSVVITDGNTCTGSGYGTLTVNPNPTVTVNSPTKCANDPAVSIIATPSPAGNYSYAWTVPQGANDPGNVASFSASIAGQYSVVITDSNTCTGSGYGTLTVNPNPTVTVNSPTKCANDPAVSIIATPSPAGNYSYAWTVPQGANDPGNVASFSASIAGQYSVVITDGNTCTGSGYGTLTVNPNPTVTVNSPTKCANDPAVSIIATPSPAGNYSYAWTVPQGANDPGNVASFSASVAGQYSVVITDGNTCTGSGYGTLTVNPNPTVTVNSPTKCANDPAVSIIATPSPAGNYSYAWTVPQGANDPGNVASFSASIAGQYSVVITDGNTCTGSGYGTLTVNPNPTVTVNSPTKCANDPAVSIIATPSPAGNYSYAWTVPQGANDPGNVASFSASIAGQYSVVITDGNTCTGSGYGTLTVNPNPTVTVNSPTKCANDPAVSIIATPSPAGNYSYAWTVPQGANDPGNVASFSASVAGQYSVVITDGNTCTGSGYGTLTVNPNPTVTVNSPTKCANDPAVSIIATPSPAGNYSYAWTVPQGANDPGNVASFSASIAGQYSVVITDGNTCTGSGYGTLTVNPNPTVTVNSPTKCANDPAVSIIATPSPAGNYSYAWTVPQGANDPGNVASFSASIAGQYSVVITDGNTCTGSGYGTLTVNPNPTVTVNSPTKCANDPAVSIIATPSPAGNYSYAWTVPQGANDPGNVASFSASVAGQYSVVITDGNTCTGSGYGTLTVNPNPTVTVNSPTKCANDPAVSIIATPSPAGNYSYAWTVPQGANDPGNVASFSASIAGQYSVVITDSNTCTGSGYGTLTVNPNPTVTVNSPTKCANDPAVSIIATPSPAGNYSYVWTVPQGANDPGNVASFSASIAGQYSVVITDGNTCTGSGYGTLTVNPNPTVTVNSPTKCANDPAVSIIATPSPAGNYSYAWTVPQGANDPGNVASFSASVAGQYSVVITDGNTCTGSGYGTLTVNPNPTVTVNSPTKCANDPAVSIIATPSPAGNYSYAWTVPQGANDPGNVASFSASIAGQYSVVITDSNACTGSGYGTLTVNPNPTVTVNSPTKCANDPAVSIIATPSPAGNYSYAWTVPQGANDPGNVASFSASVAGQYSVVITDGNTCTGSGYGTLTVNPNPTVTVNSPTKCANDPAVSIIATPSPAGNYSYAWTVPQGANDPGNVASFSASIAGQYSVVITDGNTCTGSGYGTLTVNPNPTVTVNSPTKCANDPAVSIIATPSPAGNYSYAWTVPQGANDPGNVASFSASIAGQYSVVITDSNTCTGSGYGTLTVNPNPTVTVNSPTKCANDPAVSIIATPSPAGNYSYAWTVPQGANDPGNVASFSASVAGQYSVVITDGNTCTGSGYGTLTVNPNPTVTVNSPTKCANDPAVSIIATPSPAGNYSYAWTVPQGANDPGNVASFSASVAGQYSVVITDGNTCTGSGYGTLTVNPNPTVTVNSPTKCANDPAVSIIATPSPAGNYSYAWTVPQGANDPGNVASFSASVAGQYSVVITDGNTCTGSGYGTLTVNPNPTVTVNSPTKCANDPAVSIIATPSPAGNYSYAWTVPQGANDPGNVASFSASVAGQYSVVITDGNTCTGSGYGTLTVNPNPTVTVNSPTKCANDPAVSIIATPSPAGNYSYAWTVPQGANDPGNVASFSASIAGQYSVIITDGNTCTGSGYGTLTVNPNPTVTVNSPTKCANDPAVSIIATPSPAGNYSYAWTVPQGANDPGNVASFSASIAGQYSVVITDSNTCTGSGYGTLTVNPLPDVNCASKTFDVDCAVILTLAQINASYNASFDAWYTTDFIALNPALNPSSPFYNSDLSYSTVPSIADLNAMVLDVLNPSPIEVTFTIINNATGCKSSCTSSFLFNNPCQFTCDVTLKNYLCFGESGNITVNGSGGPGPYTLNVYQVIGIIETPITGSPFTFNSISFTTNISNLLAGNYKIVVTNALNIPGEECIRNIEITGPLTAISCNLTQPTIVGCATSGNIVNGIVSGGVGPYTCSASFDAAGLEAGWSANCSINGDAIMVTYTAGGVASTVLSVEVTDANGCKSSCKVTLTCDAGKACTPGFWKNHREVWDSQNDHTVNNMPGSLPSTPGGTFITSTNFNAYFGITSFPSNLTMLGATALGGGNCKALARHGVSALLGAAAFPDDYPFESAGVDNFQQLYNLIRNAFLSGNCGPLATTLASINELDGEFCGALSKLPAARIQEIYSQVESQMFTIYPVPFKDNFTIVYEFDYKTDVLIQVFDARGRLLLNTTDKDVYKGKEMKIDFPLTHQKGEIFFIHIETNKGHFVKNISSSTN